MNVECTFAMCDKGCSGSLCLKWRLFSLKLRNMTFAVLYLEIIQSPFGPLLSCHYIASAVFFAFSVVFSALTSVIIMKEGCMSRGGVNLKHLLDFYNFGSLSHLFFRVPKQIIRKCVV